MSNQKVIIREIKDQDIENNEELSIEYIVKDNSNETEEVIESNNSNSCILPKCCRYLCYCMLLLIVIGCVLGYFLFDDEVNQILKIFNNTIMNDNNHNNHNSNTADGYLMYFVKFLSSE